jgi:small-conductance mechanosensitive channel
MELLKDFSYYFDITIKFSLILVLFYIIGLMVKYLIAKFSKNSYSLFFSNAAQFIITIVGVIIAIKFTGIDSTIILAMVAIFTAGLSLSLDSSFRDFLSGTKILLFDYYTIGDYVSFDEIVNAQVLKINIFSTTLNQLPKGQVVISNSKIADGIITNHSRVKSVRYFIEFPLIKVSDRDQIRKTILQTVEEQSHIVKNETYVYHQLTTDGELFTAQVEIDDYVKRRDIASTISIAVINKLEELGLIENEKP